MKRIRAVVFDLFGTLVPEFPLSVWGDMMHRMAAALGVDARAFEEAWDGTVVERQTGRLPDIPANLQEICRMLGVQPLQDGMRQALEAREALYRTWFRPQPGAVPTLEWLRARRYATALVSMCAPDAPALWAASPLGGLVDVLVFSSEVGLRKPDPAIYLAAAEGLGVEPAHCLYVGDGAYRELSGAAAVGMTPVRIVDPAEDAAVLRPDRDEWRGSQISSLPELQAFLDAATRAG